VRQAVAEPCYLLVIARGVFAAVFVREANIVFPEPRPPHVRSRPIAGIVRGR
jgi:hypothetical protein